MEQPAASERIDGVRRFFRFSGPLEWSREVNVSEEAAPDAYRMELLRMQVEAEALVRVLVADGQALSISRLLKNPKQELLIPVCRALAELRYGPAVTVLTKLYRGNAAESQVAILGVVAAACAMEGYTIALEATNSAHQAVREAGHVALASLGNRHQAVATIQALAASQPVPAGGCEPRELAAVLATHLPLSMGIRIVKELRIQAPELSLGVRDGLRLLDEEQKPLLLLLSQDWSLGEGEQKQCIQAFHRASAPERVTLLNAVAQPVAIRLMADGLEPTGKRNLEQVLQHLADDCSHLVSHLAESLLSCASGAPPLLGARALILAGEHLPEEEQSRAGVPRRLLATLLSPDVKPLRRALTSALVATKEGRHLLAEERLSPAISLELQGLLASRSVDGDAVFLAMAEALNGDLVLDTERLNWLFTHMDRVEPATVKASREALARAVAAQIRYGRAEVVGPLMEALGNDPGTWRLLAPQVLPGLVGVSRDRLQQIVNWTLEHDDQPLVAIASALDAIESTADVLLDALVGTEGKQPGQAHAWLEQSPHAARWAHWVRQSASDLAKAVAEFATAFESEEATDRTQLEDGARELLAELATLIPTIGEDGRELAEQLVQYLSDLEEAVYAAVDENPVPLSSAPVLLGDPVGDYLQAHVIHSSVAARYRDRHLHFTAGVGKRIGLPLEKILLLVPRLPAETAAKLTQAMADWIEAMGLQRLEGDLGRMALFQIGRHEKSRPDLELERYSVLTWGLAAPDGSILRPALVGPAPQAEGR